MGRQWERQLLLPFSFYIDAKVLLFFELAKFNLECELHGRLWEQVGVRAARAEMWDEWDRWDKWENYSVIVRLSFAHCSLFLYRWYRGGS